MSNPLEERVNAYLASKTEEQKLNLHEEYCHSYSISCDQQSYDATFKTVTDKFKDLLIVESFTREDSLKRTKNKQKTLEKMMIDFNILCDLRNRSKEWFYILFVSSETLNGRDDRIQIKFNNEDNEYFVNFEDYFRDEEYTNGYIVFYLIVSPAVVFCCNDNDNDADDDDVDVDNTKP